jgi:hypothetical protein
VHDTAAVTPGRPTELAGLRDYTSDGHTTAAAKDRMGVFRAGSVRIVDDFRWLTRPSSPAGPPRCVPSGACSSAASRPRATTSGTAAAPLTTDYHRFDPLLHLRFDGDPVGNEEIRAERLSPEEVVAVKCPDEQCFGKL